MAPNRFVAGSAPAVEAAGDSAKFCLPASRIGTSRNLRVFMAHAAEPPFTHDRIPRIGVLLTNLGTPDAATPSAVRRYLAQFLTDPRVIEIPAWAWKPILYGVILFVRPTQSAKKYAAIWTRDGSPLLVHSVRQRTLLLGYLGQRLKAAGLPADLCPVELGMRYGNPEHR